MIINQMLMLEIIQNHPKLNECNKRKSMNQSVRQFVLLIKSNVGPMEMIGRSNTLTLGVVFSLTLRGIIFQIAVHLARECVGIRMCAVPIESFFLSHMFMTFKQLKSHTS